MLGMPLRAVGGVLVLVGFGVVGLGIVLIGVGRGEGFSQTCYRVGQQLR
jgi:hypothetical protein